MTQVAANYLIGQKEAKRWGTAHGSIVPYQVQFSLHCYNLQICTIRLWELIFFMNPSAFFFNVSLTYYSKVQLFSLFFFHISSQEEL